MKVQQLSLTEDQWLLAIENLSIEPKVCLLFVSPDFKFIKEVVAFLSKKLPKVTLIGCSTAGEISDTTISDKTIVLTAIDFEKTDHKLVAIKIGYKKCSFDAGIEIANRLYSENLKHVIILSDGLNVNGTDLVAGLKANLPNVSITGGLAADGSNFKKTFVINNLEISENTILGLGLYGNSLEVGYGSEGGWDSFGIERLVTKSHKNILYELDGEPALALYKSYLGKEAENLPGSGILFPLSMRSNGISKPLVRTISGIDETNQSLSFAGNIPENSYVRLMKANMDRLIGGAETSARLATKGMTIMPDLAILISCVGRRSVLRQMAEEEIEVVREVIGKDSIMTGFYSYGEIAPFEISAPCELHTQTMTITTLREC